MGVTLPRPPELRTRQAKIDKNVLKSQVKLSTVLTTLTPLIRVGESRWQAKCPWHEDRVSSLSVNDTKGLWHCFAGCGGGDLFTLLMKIHNCTFAQSLIEAQAYAVQH